MDRPKLFENGVIPESIKEQNDGVHRHRKEKITEDRETFQEQLESYRKNKDTLEDDHQAWLRNRLLELGVQIAKREEIVRRYEEDPNWNYTLGEIDEMEFKVKVMEEIGYPEEQMVSIRRHLEDLRKK